MSGHPVVQSVWDRQHLVCSSRCESVRTRSSLTDLLAV